MQGLLPDMAPSADKVPGTSQLSSSEDVLMGDNFDAVIFDGLLGCVLAAHGLCFLVVSHSRHEACHRAGTRTCPSQLGLACRGHR